VSGKDVDLKEFKTREYSSNEARSEEHAKKFGRDAVLKSLIGTASPLVFDVGGYTGKSIIGLKAAFPDARIVSFEPNPQVIDALREVAARYRDVEVIQTAVSNRSGSIEYFQQGINPGLGGVYRRNLESKDSIDLTRLRGGDPDERSKYLVEVNKAHFSVPTTTLGDFATSRKIEEVDLIKIDVQGHEPEVLEGAGALLSRTRVVLTEISFYDLYEKSVSFFDVENVLRPHGFRLWDLSHISKNPMNGRTDWVDAIYVR
jgi:FkbM family methyltransferase